MTTKTLEIPYSYYSRSGGEIINLLPSKVERFLELGCGTGSISHWIKDHYRAHVIGIELCEAPAREAALHLDHVIVGDIEKLSLNIPTGSLDLVLCLDVLEHLNDPWTVTKRLAGLLRTGGYFITSIPNIQHYSMVLRVLCGRWSYQATGLMDKTHLRFFSRSTAIEMLNDADLDIDRVEPTLPRYERIANIATLGILQRFWTLQFLIRGVKII